MKIQYISDLHLESLNNRMFFEKYPVQPCADYLVLAGDIIPLNQIDQINFFLDHISQAFTKVFWIPGNHEFCPKCDQIILEEYAKEIDFNE